MSGQIVRGYDFDTGALLWEAAGLGENSVPQPVQHGDLVYAMSGHNVRMLLAIRLGRKGTLAGTDGIAWSTARGVSYTPSPLVHDNRLYVLTDSGLLSNFNASTGTPIYQQRRLPQPYNFKASPVGANGKLYLATEEGDVVVVRMGDSLRGAGDQHVGRAVVHRIPRDCGWRYLPAKPDARVSNRFGRYFQVTSIPKKWRNTSRAGLFFGLACGLRI